MNNVIKLAEVAPLVRLMRTLDRVEWCWMPGLKHRPALAELITAIEQRPMSKLIFTERPSPDVLVRVPVVFRWRNQTFRGHIDKVKKLRENDAGQFEAHCRISPVKIFPIDYTSQVEIGLGATRKEMPLAPLHMSGEAINIPWRARQNAQTPLR